MNLEEEEMERLMAYGGRKILELASSRLNCIPKYMQLKEDESEYPTPPVITHTVSYPKPNELQLDMDTEEQLAEFKKLQKVAASLIKPITFETTPSATPGHYHVSVLMPYDLTDLERCFLQCLFRSDAKRELFNYFRFKENGESDSCLFVKIQNELA